MYSKYIHMIYIIGHKVSKSLPLLDHTFKYVWSLLLLTVGPQPLGEAGVMAAIPFLAWECIIVCWLGKPRLEKSEKGSEYSFLSTAVQQREARGLAYCSSVLLMPLAGARALGSTQSQPVFHLPWRQAQRTERKLQLKWLVSLVIHACDLNMQIC